jgi:hypothetical protein
MLARSKTAREILARYVCMSNQLDNHLFTCILGIADGCLWNFYFLPRIRCNSSPASGPSHVPVHAG